MKKKVESAFYETIMEGVRKYVNKHTPTYSTAKVVEIKDGTPYVKFPGADISTPVTTVTNAAKGDEVLVQVNSNGDAYVYGNLTDQPVSKVEVEKITENTNNYFKQFEYSLEQIVEESTKIFVSIGESNIPTLSDVMNRSDSGPNIYGNIDTIGNNYIQVNDKGIDFKKITTAGKIDKDHDTKELHIGSDNISFGNIVTWYGNMGNRSIAIGNTVTAIGENSFVLGEFVYARGKNSAAIGESSVANGKNSFAQGRGSTAYGDHSVALNGSYTGDKCPTQPSSGYFAGHAHAENEGHANGMYSHAEGSSITHYCSSGSHAEGQNTITYESGGHSEGLRTAAWGEYAHAEGENTQAGTEHELKFGVKPPIGTGFAAHAEGSHTKALAEYSHAGGYYTIAAYAKQTVIGQYNDNQSDTIFEVGNGTADNARSNAFNITSDGYLRTGVGNTKVAFGSVNNYYGWYDSNGSFSPWAFLVNGKVPETLLPSYVDDVIEGYYYNGSFYEDDQYQTLITPERGKIYISLDTDKSYRWSGTVYVELTSGGVVYSAGTGIDISVTNEISVDNTIARVSDIPDELSDLGDDSTHRLVTDTEKSTWNAKSDFSGSYNDLTDIPQNLVQDSNYVHTDNNYTTAEKNKLAGIDLSGYLPITGGTMTGAINTQALIPDVDDSRVLGSGTKRYRSEYVRRLYALESIEKSTDTSKRLLLPDDSGTIALTKNIPSIAFGTQTNSGILLGTLTLNSTNYKIYAPKYTGGTGINIDSSTYEISVDTSIIPDELADLSDDSTHRLVTDTEKSTWNGKSDFSGSYNDLSDKPPLGTAAAKDIPSSGNASSIQVVLGSDTRLTDARNAADVYSWAKAATKPSYNASEITGLAAVATSGSYNDLSNKPTIPDISTKVSKSGDTMTGDLNFGNGIGIKGYNWSNGYGVNIYCGVELWPNSTTGDYGGYIDFHYNKDSSDRTSRIIENASGRLSINGALFSSNGKIEGNQISANNTGSGAATNAAFKASTSTSSQIDYYIGNSVAQGALEVTSAGILGLWSYQKGGWVHYTDSSGNTTFYGNASTATKASYAAFPRLAVNFNTAMTTRANGVFFDELNSTSTGIPSYISTFSNPWFNLMTMHSADGNYGSQFAVPMTGFTAPAWRYYSGASFGSWEYIPSADTLSVGSSSQPAYMENGKLKAVSGTYFKRKTENRDTSEYGSDANFKGPAGWGNFDSSSSIGRIIDNDGCYIFIPYGDNSDSYGWALACDDEDNTLYLGNLSGNEDDTFSWHKIYHDGTTIPVSKITGLAAVATSGSYNDLSNKPTIPDISTKVSKSGDTMSGNLTVNAHITAVKNGTNYSNGPLEVRGDSNGTLGAGIGFHNAGERACYLYYSRTNSGYFDNVDNISKRNGFIMSNSVINPVNANGYDEGLRINSTQNNAHGYALITIGGQYDSTYGVNDSYPTYQIGKWNDGNFYMGFRSTTTGNNENFLRYFPSLNGGGAAGTLCIGTRNYTSSSSDTRVLCSKDFITEASSGGKVLLLLFAQARASTAYNVRLYRVYNNTVSYISLGSTGSSLGTVSISGNNLIFTPSVAGVDIYPLFIGAN